MIGPKKKVSKTQTRRKHGEWQRVKLKQLNSIQLSLSPETGEVHLSHRVTPKGRYRGKQIFSVRTKTKETVVDAD